MASIITIAFCRQIKQPNELLRIGEDSQNFEEGLQEGLKNYIKSVLGEYLSALEYIPKCEINIFANMDRYFLALKIDGALMDDLVFIDRIIAIIRTEGFIRIAICQININDAETDKYISVIEAEKLIRICYDNEILINEYFNINLRNSMNQNLRFLNNTICKCTNLCSKYFDNREVYIIDNQINQACARDFLLTTLSEEQCGFCCKYGLEKYMNSIHEQISDKDEILLSVGVTDVLKLLSQKVKELDDISPNKGQLLCAIFRADAPIGFWSGKGASGYKQNLVKYIEIERQARVIIFQENNDDNTDYHFPNKIVIDIAELYNNSEKLKIINKDRVDSTQAIIRLYPNGITLFPSIGCAVIPELPQESYKLRVMKSYHDFFEFKAKIVIGEKYHVLKKQFDDVYLKSASVKLSRLQNSYRPSKIQELSRELYNTINFDNIDIICDKCESINISDNNIGVFVVHSMLKRIQKGSVDPDDYSEIRDMMIRALGGNLDSLYSLTNTNFIQWRSLFMIEVNVALLVSELKEQIVFRHFWNHDFMKLIPHTIELDYMPTETMGYYGKKIDIELESYSHEPLLKEFKALLVINFTSTTRLSIFEKALHVDDSIGDIFAVNIFVKVIDKDHKQVVTYRKCLWSKEPAEICGDPIYVKVLINDEVKKDE